MRLVGGLFTPGNGTRSRLNNIEVAYVYTSSFPHHTMPMSSRILPALLVVLCATVAGCRTESDGAKGKVQSAGSGSVATVVDMPMPEFKVQTVQGDSLTDNMLRGRISLVNFWATWCAPCIVETPELVGLQEEWKDRPFRIVGISLDTYAGDEVEDFVENFHIQYPVFVDQTDLANGFGGAYALPTTFLVDAEGIIRKRWVGLFPFDEAREELDALIRNQEMTGSK